MQPPVVETSRPRTVRRCLARLALATLLALQLVTCSSGKKKPVEKDPYTLDIEQICHAEERSGALEQDPSVRSVQVAAWLANHLVTDQSRLLLGKLAALAPADKATALAAEAKKVGVAPCPMVQVWSAK